MRLPDGGVITGVQMLSDSNQPGDAPHAFLVRQSPGASLGAHFHLSRQFQVFVDGSGVIGRHEVAPLTVHYAASETGYGPIVAGPSGLAYLTLRQVTERGAHPLPGESGRRRRGAPRRQFTSRRLALGDPPAAVESVLPADETGLAAWLLRAAPGEAIGLTEDAAGCDRYLVLVGGSLHVATEVLPLMSVIWASAEGEDMPLAAGVVGAEVLVLQFPRSA